MGVIGERKRGIDPQLVGSEKLPGGNDIEVKTQTSGARPAELISNKVHKSSVLRVIGVLSSLA